MPSKPEVIKERLLSDPEYAERIRGYGRKYRESNKDAEKERNRVSANNKRASDRESYNAYMREWREKNKDAINARTRELRKLHPERFKAASQRKYAKNPLAGKLRNYGISKDEFFKMKEDQKHCCAICGTHEKDAGKNGLAIDHCHSAGHVRGLLCSHCNTGLGQFRDSVDLLGKAIQYLKG